MWLRNDLRLADNPALYHASQQAQNHPLAVVFVHCQSQDRLIHHESEAKITLRLAHVKTLLGACQNHGVATHELDADTYQNVAHLLKITLLKQGVTDIHWNASTLLNEQRRDDAVKQALEQSGVRVHQYPANYLFPMGQVRKSDGSMYHVFTPYKRQMVKQLHQFMPMPLPQPAWVSRNVEDTKVSMDGWPVGETAALQRLQDFVADNDYANERDRPDVEGTSQLSPYLALGVLSARQCLAQAIQVQGESALDSVWVSELIWREYYADLCWEYPQLVKNQAFKAEAKDHWPGSKDLFDAWRKGVTGFPLVDAGIRQLLQTGWMHNRLRMVTASFLCKLCLVDWRLGERFFMQHLIDGDFASNNGGWQWSSSTGCDAAPFFRIFNPETQSRKFDPQGSFISQYIPELRGVSVKEIHDPSPETRKQTAYPLPIIDYKASREAALLWHKN